MSKDYLVVTAVGPDKVGTVKIIIDVDIEIKLP